MSSEIVNLEYVKGDLLLTEAQYIAHQCNCISNNAVGLAKTIFEKYPDANIYKIRTNPSIMGTIDVRGNVINMFAQYYPGKVKTIEDTKNRLLSFRNCLIAIAYLPNCNSVAFPYNIACGYGGGIWKDYLSLIEEFAKMCSHIKIFIVKL